MGEKGCHYGCCARRVKRFLRSPERQGKATASEAPERRINASAGNH